MLDIDETSLSNYTGLLATGFTRSATSSTRSRRPARRSSRRSRSTSTLARRAWRCSSSPGRPPQIAGITALNLVNEGYDKGWDGLHTKPTDIQTAPFKTFARATIEARGYEIVANVGDQESDLDGGHADRAFKLPNPFYFIPD